MTRSVPMPARWFLILAVLSLVAAACGTDEPEDADEAMQEDVTEPEGEPADGGTLVFGHEQEPAILNPHLTEGNLRATSLVTRTVLQGSMLVTPDFDYVPQLVEEEPEIVEEDPFTVEWNIREEAEWSDGTPVTADDWQFTYDTIMDEDVDIVSRNGYEQMTETEVVDDKTWRATYDEPFAPAINLFSTVPILPAHVLEGEDFNDVWNDAIIDPETEEPIANGPFQFEEWDRGQSITLTRNEAYWGEQQANLDEIIFTYIEESPTLVQQIRGGEIQAFDPQPQVELIEQLEGIDGVDVQVDAGPQWEHIDFNFENELLAEDYVRHAIIQGIDREAIVEQLVRGVNPDAGVLNNAIFVENQEMYEQNWDIWDYDPDAAVDLLEENGCTREGEGTFECDGEELNFRYVGTAGNERRELMFEIIQANLNEIGIELEADFSEPADALGTKLPEGDFDIINFGWVGSPDPFGGDTIFQCEGDLNYNNYCNEEASDLIESNVNFLDEDERWGVYNEADALIAEDVPLIPIYQQPETLAYENNIGGMRINATQWTPTWNAQEWYLTEE
jgi:peptide/nickel transport system substrate-binding protein